ncbi:hypothetical protein DVH05_011716 [Phytophthora capsici]|nr:hypothetical protein DVH05_011716 [Phytophthora capsici]|eukprot:jgi/Phyca11/16485/fgenesh1_pg.PHYCAscaffold_20_\
MTTNGSLDLRRGSVSFLLPEEQHMTLLDLYYSFPNWNVRLAKTSGVHYGHKWVDIYNEMKTRYPDLAATKSQLESLCVRARKKRRFFDLEEQIRHCEENKRSFELAADEMKLKLTSRDKALKECNEEKNKILDLFHENGRKVQALESALKEKKDLETKLMASNKENEDLKVERTADKKEINDLKTKLMASKKKSKFLLRALGDEEENDDVEVEVS